MKIREVVLLVFILSSLLVRSSVWHIGSARTYTLPSQVANLVQDGDTVYIDGGVYLNDATKWAKKNLKIIGLGTGSNRSILRYSGYVPNGKGIFVFESPGICDNAYLDNLVFDGALVTDANGANGAGVRFQASNLTVTNCKFMNCQNGILEGHGSVSNSNVIIQNTEFYNNGYQQDNNATYSGYEHHIYISASADTLVVQNCYFHHPRGQANSIKTRAQRSYLLYNMIDEEATGYGSWEVNIAQGGMNVVMGNVIIQGSSGANHGIVGYDAATNPLEEFYFVNNTVINQFAGNNKYFNIVPTSGINVFKVFNNIFASVSGASNTMYAASTPSVLNSSNNWIIADYTIAGFTNPTMLNYSLTAIATGAINLGTSAGFTNSGYPLQPVYSYSNFANTLSPRLINGGIIDIGAYELSTGTGVVEAKQPPFSLHQIPGSGCFYIRGTSKKNLSVEIIAINGQITYANRNYVPETVVDCSYLPRGIYFIRILDGVQATKLKLQL